MITGFRLVGVDGIEVASADEARQTLRTVLTRSDIGIIIISEAFSNNSSIQNEINNVRQERVTPLIVEIPGGKGQSNITQLSDTISKILGIKL
jgi:vacuolar-type H+-ATPase subunit F/Vma7